EADDAVACRSARTNCGHRLIKTHADQVRLSQALGSFAGHLADGLPYHPHIELVDLDHVVDDSVILISNAVFGRGAESNGRSAICQCDKQGFDSVPLVPRAAGAAEGMDLGMPEMSIERFFERAAPTLRRYLDE